MPSRFFQYLNPMHDQFFLDQIVEGNQMHRGKTQGLSLSAR